MTRDDLIVLFNQAGINVGTGWLLLDRRYEPVNLDKIQAIAEACLDALPKELVSVLHVGGGKTRRIPLWVEEAGDCDNASVALWLWAMIGNWHKAVVTREQRGGLATGIILYAANSRSANRMRDGNHCVVWFVDPTYQLRYYEFGDNIETFLTAAERRSVFGGAAV